MRGPEHIESEGALGSDPFQHPQRSVMDRLQLVGGNRGDRRIGIAGLPPGRLHGGGWRLAAAAPAAPAARSGTSARLRFCHFLSRPRFVEFVMPREVAAPGVRFRGRNRRELARPRHRTDAH